MVKRCNKCLLPEYRPHIILNDKGICDICESYEDRSSKPSNALLESKLYNIIKKYRGQGKYDCLVMCSGGKDSTSALYQVKKRYDLNPLAFTFDNGFETERALKNVQNAVESLDVDWIKYKSNFMKDMFREIIQRKSKASICQVCSIWYMQVTHDISARFNTPLIVAGWTEGQSLTGEEDRKEYMPFSEATKEFIEDLREEDTKYEDFPKTMDEALKKGKEKIESKIISPHWFLSQNPEDLVPTLKEELNWKEAEESYPKGSTNCKMNYASVLLSMKHFGYTHYHIEQSKLIRKREVLRSEAKQKLKLNFDLSYVNSILKEIDCEISEEI